MISTTRYSQHNFIKYTSPKLTASSNFLSQVTSWAKVWMSSSNTTEKRIPRKRKTSSISSSSSLERREMDIRSRINYYEQKHQQPSQPQLQLTQRDLSNLFRATCQKLRPNSLSKARRLGDILHIRKLWDQLEPQVYQELGQQPHYLPPSKRTPFNPEKPGSAYLPRRSKRHIMVFAHFSRPKRSTFASTTIVYISQNNIIKMVPLIVASAPAQQKVEDSDEDDDDVPLGALLQLSSFSSSVTTPQTNYILRPPQPSHIRR